MNGSLGFRMMCCLAVCVLLGALPGKGQSTNRYVVHPDNLPDGWTPDTEYLTWLTAATNIQDAVTKAVAAVGDYVGDTVVVTDGVFRSSSDPVVTIAKNIRVTSVNGPAYTSIDGQGIARCVTISKSAMLDGFTIKNGLAGQYGAGIYNSADAPLISNCVVVANTVGGAASLSLPGAGIHIKNALVRNCLIVSNLYQCTGTYGGGGGVGFASGTGLLADSTVRANSSTVNDGGGVWGYSGGAVSNCVIADNSAVKGGGGIFWYGNATDARRISGCVISNNSAGIGGGLYLQFTPNYVEHCTIVDNVATNASGTAGGLYASLNSGGQRLEVHNSQIVGNSSGGNGSGIYFTMRYTTTVTVLRNLLIARNSTQSGLYIYNNATEPSRAVIQNVTAVSNRAYGFYLTGNHDVQNCIVYSNASADISFNGGASEAQSVSNSCFAASSLTNHNIKTDPLLADWVDGYRLASGSPCINTGANPSWMSEPGAKDLDGRPRLDRFSGLPDMGAYEYVPAGSLMLLR